MTEKYKRMINNNEKNIAAKDALKFLNSLKTKSSEKIVDMLLEDYVERWIEITDRGGLMKVKEEVYSFVLKLEGLAHSFVTVNLSRKNQKEDTSKIFKVKLKTVLEVSAIWVSLSRKMPKRKLSNKLFKQIIDKWIKRLIGLILNGFCLCYIICANFDEMKKVYSVEPIKKSELAFTKKLVFS